ncbi:TIGR00730 family Rossman fold protein [Actinobacillus genomosp. 1]|uniref:LOG family protein n=1 Tax=Actinobacillus genomosp. 1 TaxID=254839 RepID=UPI0024421AAF|nr:TIGR00730 family Rossman fold protein [Actinobacillus genomosp. 1]WGE91283.1 TIGR00730 family Rossman fold protein [Actinobacillus genomosp. 1]
MNITVYCGANVGNKPQYQQAAHALGEWIAKGQHQLIYGGGKAGLMGIVADSVLAQHGKVTGVIPTFLQERELAHPSLTELITVKNMPERKLKMIELGDAYIALPGGPGTLEEITEVVSWARIGQNNNPCIFFDVVGYYRPLQAFYQQMVDNGFLSQTDLDCVLFSDDLSEIEQFIQNYRPPEIRRY